MTPAPASTRGAHEPRVAGRAAELPLVGSRALDRVAEEMREAGLEVLALRAYPIVPAPPTHVVEAGERAMRSPRTPPSHGLSELRGAIAEVVGAELMRPIDPRSEVVVTSGGMHALYLVLSALVGPGDEVVIPTPSYFFDGLVQLCGGRIRAVPSGPETEFAIDPSAVEDAITERTKAILLTSPNNPTGRVLDANEVAAFADIAARRNVWLVSDESYDRLTFDGRRHISVGSIRGLEDRTVVIRSFTKSYALPNLRVGYVIAPVPVAAAVRKLLEWTNLYGNDIVQAMAAAAMLGPQGWLESATRDFQQRRNEAVSLLSGARGLHLSLPQGGPFLFINIEALGSDQDVSAGLLRECGVPAVPGSCLSGPGYIRLSYGGAPEVVREALHRLKSYAHSQLSIQDAAR